MARGTGARNDFDAEAAGPARWHQTLVLPDGRRLGYADYGDPAGRPVIGLHGTPGSRLMLQGGDEPARRLGIRLIAPDRPGLGLSDPQPGRSYGDHARDVAILADRLGIARFPVAGVSGGGPYAAACGALIPERLTGAVVVSGVAPVRGPDATPGLQRKHRLLFGAGARAPAFLRAIMTVVRRAWQRRPEATYRQVLAMNPPVDQAVMRQPDVRRALIEAALDAFRQGSSGPAAEVALFGRPWGFRLNQVTVPIKLWHGEEDRLVPVTMGRHMASRMPRVRATFIPGAGHYWVFDHMETVLRAAIEP